MKTKVIIDYFNEILPNAKCELNYTKDYELLLATMLSAQTTDKRVNMVTSVLFKKYPSLNSLANADHNDVISIIRSIGTYQKKASNLIKIANLLKDLDKVPNDRDFLESLPGVGRKTTNVFLSNIYNVPLIAVDTHVKRVSIRLGLASSNDNVLVIEKKLNKLFKKEELSKLHHQLVLFGRYYCTSRKPSCEACKLKDMCKYYQKNCL